MKKIMVLILAAATFSISYVVAETVGERTDQAIEQATDKKDQFVKEMDQQITELSNEIESLRIKAKDKSKTTIEKLEVKRDKLQVDLKKLKNSSSKAGSKLEAGVKRAWSALKDSVQSAKKEFQE